MKNSFKIRSFIILPALAQPNTTVNSLFDPTVSCHSHSRVAASKLKALGMVNTGETIPNPFDFAQGGAALEAATLPDYQIKFDRLLRY